MFNNMKGDANLYEGQWKTMGSTRNWVCTNCFFVWIFILLWALLSKCWLSVLPCSPDYLVHVGPSESKDWSSHIGPSLYLPHMASPIAIVDIWGWFEVCISWIRMISRLSQVLNFDEYYGCPLVFLSAVGRLFSHVFSEFDFRHCQCLFFPTSLWGFCFLACIPPAVVRRRPPSSAAALSHTHITKLISSYTSHVTSYTTHPTSHTTHLTHNSSHTTLISHTHTSQNLSHTISYTTHLTHLISYITSHTTHLTHTHTHITKLIIHTPHLIHHITHHSSHTHTSQNLSHHTQVISHHTQLIPHTTHLTHNSSHRQCVAGAVRRAAWRRCGADSRRRGRGSLLRGRRSTQSVLKELRRGLSPAGPRLLFAWQTQYTEPREGAAARIVAGWAAAPLCVADAVHRASWRSCGADCRRLGRGSSLPGRRSTQSLLKELRRGLSPAGPRLLFAWQTQYTEPPEGAQIVAGWAAAPLCVADVVHRASWRSCGADCRRLGRGSSLRGRRSTQSLLKELRRGLSPAGPRLLFAWQTQYTEPPEGAAARIVAGWAAAPLCVADAVHRASWRSCGADCRRLGRGSFLRGRRSTQSLLKELRRGLSPAEPRLLFAWQTQYTEPPEGAAARILAGWAAAALHSALPHHSLHTTDLTPAIAQHSSRNQSAHTTHLSPVIPHHTHLKLFISYPSSHSTNHTTAYLATTDLTPLIL